MTTLPAPWRIFCDGSAVPNPGRMGLGALLVSPDGSAQHTLSEATTFTGCNNEAELRALLTALHLLGTHVVVSATFVHICSDSSVLVAQLGAPRGAPIARLASLYDEARQALQQFQRAEVQWIPRHHNGTADALARAALGLAPKVAIPAGQKIKRRKRR